MHTFGDHEIADISLERLGDGGCGYRCAEIVVLPPSGDRDGLAEIRVASKILSIQSLQTW
jgi:hypothetical protein